MNQDQKFELAEQIAAALGGVIVNKEHWAGADNLDIKLPGHEWARIHLKFDGWRQAGRLRVCAVWPTRAGYGTARPSYFLGTATANEAYPDGDMTVDYTRPLSAIVKTIERRVVKGLVEVLTLMKAASDVMDAKEARLDALYKEVSDLVGCTSYMDGAPHRRANDRSFSTGWALRGEVQSDGGVKLELRDLTPDQARQIISIAVGAKVETA